MSVVVGTRLGTYEIRGLIGVGGIGEVYRAYDERLGREVALKVLPDSVASDRDRLARFRHEAQVLASLNHPHIAALHGIEDANGVIALAMEFVEGPTLADQIAGRPMTPHEAIPVARQIAEALEYAHERGVVHRDLKPANVKITPEGAVKVLDFGMAKVAAASTRQGQKVSATSTLADTAPGIVLGTVSYMSPEQAAGRAVDRRADIWSFGVVLWEMLTGERLFRGESASEILADVLRAEIDVSRLPASTPLVVRALVGRCLDRNLRNRLRDIGEARFVLEQCEADPSGSRLMVAPAGPDASPRSRTARLRAWLPAGLAVLGVVALAWPAAKHLTERPSVAPLMRFQVPRPTDTVLRAWDNIALSPDGRQLAMTAGSRAESAPELWIRSFDAVEPRRVPGTEGAFSPFWSADGTRVGFFTGHTLKTVNVAGGYPVTVCTFSGYPLGGSWAPGGTIVFATDEGPLQQVSAAGGVPRALLGYDTTRQEHAQHWPQVLRDGRHVVYLSEEGPQRTTAIYLAEMNGGTVPRKIAVGDGAPRHVPGYLVYSWGGNLVAHPFDDKRLETTGDSFVITGPTSGARGDALLSRYDVASTGVLAYTRRPVNESRIAVVGRDGRALGTLGEPGTYRQLALSPDDRYLAIERVDAVTARGDIWLLDIVENYFTRLTLDRDDDKGPVWSPDSGSIAFSSNRRGSYDVFRRRLGGDDEPLVTRPGEDTIEDWASDNSLIVTATAGREFVRVPLDGGREPQTMLDAPGQRDEPHVSPDGQWIAWSSMETGRWEVYVARFPQLTDRRQVSAGGGFQPIWRADGREMIYMATDGHLVAAAITTKTLAFGRATPLFRANLAPIAAWNQYAIRRDGTRFYLIEQAQEDGPVIVVLNWAAARGGE